MTDLAAGLQRGSGADLVGRSSEVEHLLRLVSADDVRLVTLTGMPGVGKTRVARAVVGAVPANVLFVPLSTVSDPRLVGDAIVRRLPEHAGLTRSVSEAIWETYGGGRVVIVLDDVDRVADLPATVAELLDSYPSSVLLVTAIRPPGLAAEHLVRLAPLPVPADDADADHPAVVFVHPVRSRCGSPLGRG